MGNFTIGPALCIKLWYYVWPNWKFLIFLFQFGSLAIKAMAFWKNLPLALLRTTKIVSHVRSNTKFLIFPLLVLVQLLSKPWHFGKFHCFPTKICHFSKLSKQVYKFNTPSYSLHFGNCNMGIIDVKIHHLLCKMLCK